jgi:hypothetical protein
MSFRVFSSFTPVMLTMLLHSSVATAKPTASVSKLDPGSLKAHFKGLGYKTRGGIDRGKSSSNSSHFRSMPHFSSAFIANGQIYPYTMVGNSPTSNGTVQLKSVIVPLRMQFVYFGDGSVNVSFDPAKALTSILNSPIYNDASFPNGVGQFGDQLQRATFWNKMDSSHNWHVKMNNPRVVAPINIEVTPETGALYQDSLGNFFGDVLIDFMDAQIQTIVQLANIAPDEVPIFVTQNVTAEALGYHTAFSILNSDSTETLQTAIYTSWLDPDLVDPLFADISTLNHEQGEWLNDPFINDIVPIWMYPPASDPRTVCSQNPFLEVGDPQGNGPTFDDFPTYVVTVNGMVYHLQQVVMLPWFADEVPSSAQNGWYTFPMPTYLKAPAVYCQ